MKGACLGTGSFQQDLEEGKIEVWYTGQGKLLEGHRMHRTAATMGDIEENEPAFCTTDARTSKKM